MSEKPTGRAPGLVQVEDNTSVNWKVKTDASSCTYLTFEWCEYLHKPCEYSICPHRVDGSFTKKKE